MKCVGKTTILIAMQACLTGCVVFPHGDLVAPPARGKVVDSETREPIPKARVTRRIAKLGRERVVFTNERGDFAFKKDQDLGWLLMVDYAPNQIQYRVEVVGYCAFETNLYGGGSFYRGTLPHDIGVVPLRKQ